MNDLKKEIEKEYSWYLMDNNGKEPNVANVKVKWNDKDTEEENIDIIGIDGQDVSNLKDDNVLFYVSNIDTLTRLCDKDNGEDFVITKFISFETI